MVLSPKVWMCMPRLALASLPLMSQVILVGADSDSCSKTMEPVTLESPRTTQTVAIKVSKADSDRPVHHIPPHARPPRRGTQHPGFPTTGTTGASQFGPNGSQSNDARDEEDGDRSRLKIGQRQAAPSRGHVAEPSGCLLSRNRAKTRSIQRKLDGWTALPLHPNAAALH